jgi:hypothetical protein
MKTTTRLTPSAADNANGCRDDLRTIFALALSRIAREPQKAEAYMKYAQNLLESLGAVKTLTTEKRSA